MKAYDRFIAVALLFLALVFVGANMALTGARDKNGKPYRVEISRLSQVIEKEGLEAAFLKLKDCAYVTDVVLYDGSDGFFDAENDCEIRLIEGEMYRFDYRRYTSDSRRAALVLNVILAGVTVLVLAVLFYIRIKLLLPFKRLSGVCGELAKGNLTVPLKESKNRFFDRFVWGVNMLRESMEEQKRREFDMLKEKKTLLLSVSHDIKTPLSLIKLYASALSKGLYKDGAKQLEIARSINEKADEIEGYIQEIVSASREDILGLDVKMGEFYISGLIDRLKEYYKDRLSLLKTGLAVGEYSDRLIKGDMDRSFEVLQNIMENAIKYGDGDSIDISFGDEEGCQLITVKNGGCTLLEEELLYIFDSFYRGSNSHSVRGSGLGLYICRVLMNKMGGEIFARLEDGKMSVTAVFTLS